MARTPEEIRLKAGEINDRLKEHDGARKLIEAELLALQHVCPHKNATSHSDHGSYGGPDFALTYWNCPDCGLQKVT